RGHYRRAGHLEFVEMPDDVDGRALVNPSAQNRVELDPLDRFEVGPRVLPFRIMLVEPDRAQQPIVDVRDRANHDIAVAGLEAVERLKALRLVARTFAHHPFLEI